MLKGFFDKITRGSIRLQWVTILVSVLLLVAGVLALTQFNQELIPPVEFPQSVVLAFYQGAAPEEVLEEITIPIEDAVRDVEGVVYVESNTGSGFAAVIISSEYGLDQDALRKEIQSAVADLQYPEEVETPELLAFSLSDLPVASVSASSSELTLDELKALVEDEIVPQLEAQEGVAQVSVSGGQELPEEVELEVAAQVEEPTPIPTVAPTQEPTATPTEEPTLTPTREPTAIPEPTRAPAEEAVDIPELEPAPLPESWVQNAAAMGFALETTADLTAEVLEGIVSFAPQMLDELEPEMLLVMPLEALAILPEDYLAGLDAETQAALVARVMPAEPGGDEVVQAPEVEPVALPESWVQNAAAMGFALETTADLTAKVLEGIVSFAPQMLDELEPEMLLAMPLEALAALPEEYLAGLDKELQKELLMRLNSQPAEPAEEEMAGKAPALPESWIAMAAESETPLPMAFETAADLANNPFNMSVAELFNLLLSSGMLPDPGALMADLTPELVQYWADADPTFFSSLSPDVLTLLPEQVLAIFPEDVLAALAEQPAAEDEADQSPALPESWLALAETVESPVPLEFATAADLLHNSLNMGVADLLNLMVGSGMLPDPGALLGDLTPEIMQYWIDADPAFLSTLSSDTVALLSDDVMALLPEELLADLDSAEEEAAALSADAPPLPDSWTDEDSPFQTTADLLNNPFSMPPGQLLNFVVGSNPASLYDLTPEVITWLTEQDQEFLSALEPSTLRLFSPEVLAGLPAEYLDSLDPDLKTELEGLAAGTIEIFLPKETLNRTNGRPSLTLSIFKVSEGNTVAVSHTVFDKLDELEAEHDGLRFDVAFEQASFIEESISGVAREGGLGAIFAVLVILLFLSGFVNGRYTLSWRSTLVTAVSIPLSVMMGFALMKWMSPVGNTFFASLAESTQDVAVIGALASFMLKLFPENITLNIMTLSGMTVAVGRVVDDSIVVLENIYRHIQRGDDPRQSVIAGTRGVAIPIFASTVTTVVVFLPIGLMGGLIGNFFLPFGLTVTYALASSFVVAITIVPLLAYLFIRKEHLPAEQEETTLQRAYTPFLKWALGHRFWTLSLVAIIFVASMWLLMQRPQTFIPEMGEPAINVTVDLPNGMTMAETNDLVLAMESVLASIEGIEVYQSQIGSGGGMESQMFASGVDQSAANLAVSVESLDDLDTLTVKIREQAEAVFGDENVLVSAGGGLTGGSLGGFDLVVTGPPEELAKIDVSVAQTLERVDGLVNVSSNLAAGDTIIRVDGQPAVQYTGEIESKDTMGVLAAAKLAVQEMDNLPAGANVSEGFMASMQTDGFRQSVQGLFIAIVVVYVVMVATFGSLAQPFVILFSLPLAVVGAALGLWITDKVVGISAMVGLMMLVGIVVTNAIVLVDRVNMNRKERGMGIYDALIEAGRTRLRPILMTAIAAILALAPLGMGATEGALIASDLAVVVIGGLTTSTLLTLLVVPVVYSLVESVLRRFRRS